MTPEQLAERRRVTVRRFGINAKVIHEGGKSLLALLDALDAAEAEIARRKADKIGAAPHVSWLQGIAERLHQELVAAEARAERAEADADRLAAELRGADMQVWQEFGVHEDYEPCEALVLHDEAVKQRP